MNAGTEPHPTKPVGKHQYGVPLKRGPRLRLDQHTDAPDRDDVGAVGRWLRAEMAQGRPTAIDLFCGAGGLSLGLDDAGFSVVVAADVDPYSIETHRHNLGCVTYLGDLSNPDDFLKQLDEWGI